MPSLSATRPAEPHAEAKVRLAAAVEAARDEILDLSHRIHADPEPAFEEHQASAWVAEALRAARVRRRAPGRQPRDGHPGRPPRRARRRRAADRDPRRVRRAARVSATAAGTTRWPPPAWAPRSPSRRWPTSCPARSSSSARRPRSGGAARPIDDRRTACSPASTRRCMYHPCDRNHVESWPLASEDVDVVFHGLQAHASSDPWKGRNALDAMILLFSSVGPVAPAAPADRPRPRDHPGGRHRREHHPGADGGLVHDPQRRRARTTRRCATASRRCATPRPWRPARPSR